jgi:hypothetical protein
LLRRKKNIFGGKKNCDKTLRRFHARPSKGFLIQMNLLFSTNHTQALQSGADSISAGRFLQVFLFFFFLDRPT